MLTQNQTGIITHFEFTTVQLVEFYQHCHQYICPSCGRVVFSSDDARLSCSLCSVPLQEVIA